MPFLGTFFWVWKMGGFLRTCLVKHFFKIYFESQRVWRNIRYRYLFESFEEFSMQSVEITESLIDILGSLCWCMLEGKESVLNCLSIRGSKKFVGFLLKVISTGYIILKSFLYTCKKMIQKVTVEAHSWRVLSRSCKKHNSEWTKFVKSPQKMGLGMTTMWLGVWHNTSHQPVGFLELHHRSNKTGPRDVGATASANLREGNCGSNAKICKSSGSKAKTCWSSTSPRGDGHRWPVDGDPIPVKVEGRTHTK